MNRHTFRSSIFITAMLAASAAFAGADIVKCVDQHGQVTLTDAQCDAGVQTVVVAGVANVAPADAAETQAADNAAAPAPAVARRVATQRVAFAPAPIQHDSWSAKRPTAGCCRAMSRRSRRPGSACKCWTRRRPRCANSASPA